MILLLSSCSKSPADSQNNLNIDIDINEELILFVRWIYSSSSSELCVMRPDGSNIQVIGRHGYGMARWSPDKTKIVIIGGPGSTRDIHPLWLMNIHGRMLHQFTPSGSNQVWSHDGEYILFQGGTKYVLSVNIDGTGKRIIYEVDDIDSTDFHLHDVSASGEYILGTETLYYTNEEGKLSNTDGEILKIHLETGEKVYLTDNELIDYASRYNSDETMIAYISVNMPEEAKIKNISNVYVMSSDGSNKRRVTNYTRRNEIYPSIAWSPDGKKIAYSKYNNIFIVDIISGNVFNLTNTDSIRNDVMDWK